MTEEEYIDATNLAKVRSAKAIVRDCLSMSEHETAIQRDIQYLLSRWEGILSEAAKVTEFE